MKLPKAQNLLLLAVMLAVSLLVWLYAGTGRREGAAVSLPVSAALIDPALPPAEQYRLRRDDTELRDLAALEALCAAPQVDAALRADAAAQLQLLVSIRERQLAVEAALLESGYGACVAVIGGDGLTIVTDQSAVSGEDSELLLRVARLHAGVAPENVRVICTAE